MARNAFESDFRSSKMAAVSHFVNLKKIQSCVLIWNGLKCDLKWFSVFQNGRRQPFCEQNKKMSIDLKWRVMRSFIQNGRRQPFCEKKSFLWNGEKCGHPRWGEGSQWPGCKPIGDIHSICPWANTPILVFIRFWYLWSLFIFCPIFPLSPGIHTQIWTSIAP